MLVSMKKLLQDASKDGYAVIAPNVFTEFDARTYLEVAEDMAAPIILAVANPCTPDLIFLGNILKKLAEDAAVPAAVHLDHGADISQVMKAIRGGLSSVMLDASSLPYEENISAVRRVTEIAAPLDISVEAELGHVGAGADYETDQALTDPAQAREFIDRTGIDALAVSIGTAHGTYKGTPHIDFERLLKIKKATRGFPLVLHGSSGTGEANIRRACQLGINKVNVCNDMLKAVYRKVTSTNLSGDAAYDLWETIKGALSDEIHRQIDMTGSEGKTAGKVQIAVSNGLHRFQITMRE